jgi:hypothetical protein
MAPRFFFCMKIRMEEGDMWHLFSPFCRWIGSIENNGKKLVSPLQSYCVILSIL